MSWHGIIKERMAAGRRDERGAYAILMSLTLILVIALAAIAVDVAKQVESKQSLRDTMDAAAHAAVFELSGSTPLAAATVAQTVAAKNGFNGTVGSDFFCVVASTGADKKPVTSQIPGMCNPGGTAPYANTKCDEVLCFIPCAPVAGNATIKCNTVRLAADRDVEYDFAPVIGFDQGNTGSVVSVACKGACGVAQPNPMDIVIMADRTQSMYMNTGNSHAATRNMLTGIKGALATMNPDMHYVALGAVHKSVGTDQNCLMKSVSAVASAGSKPTRSSKESTTDYQARVVAWEQKVAKWEAGFTNGTWVPVGFTRDYMVGGALNPNSKMVKAIDCVMPPASDSDKDTSSYAPTDYRTHLASALKGAGRYLLDKDNHGHLDLLPKDRPGIVQKVIIFETDGQPDETFKGAKKTLNQVGDMGEASTMGTPNSAGNVRACQNFVDIAEEIKNEPNTVIITIGFGAANTTKCGAVTAGASGSGELVRDMLARAASPHPGSGTASQARDCSVSSNAALENTDGDRYYCAATGADLASVFTTALNSLSTGVKLLKMPS